MSTTVLDEIIEKTAALTSEECNELSIGLLEQYKTKLVEQSDELRREELKSLENALTELKQLLRESRRENELVDKKNISPNIEWLKAHQSEFAGNYVALKDGRLIAVGKTIKEADLRAKEKGFDKTLLHYIPAENEEVWGGW